MRMRKHASRFSARLSLSPVSTLEHETGWKKKEV